jgi:hypothetical protein
VKPSDYPEDDARTVPFQPEPEESPRRSAEVRPRYVDLPVDPETRQTARNLSFGIATLSLAAIGLWLSSYFAGAAGVVTVAGCLASFGVAVLFQRTRVLGQKHGVLFGLGLAALLGAALPFISAGVRKVDAYAKENLGDEKSTDSRTNAPLPPPSLAQGNLPPPPVTPHEAIAKTSPEEDIAPEPESKPAKKIVASKKPEKAEKPEKSPLVTRASDDDSGIRELIVPVPPEGSAKLVTIKQRLKVNLEERPLIIPAGTVTTYKSLEDGILTFVVADHEIQVDTDKLDKDAFKFGGRTQEKPEDLVAISTKEAMYRYPNLGVDGSKENLLFVTTVKELKMNKDTNSALFNNPNWPLMIAEKLATSEHWQRADLAPDKTENEAPGNTPAPDAANPETVPAGDVPPPAAGPAERPIRGALPPASAPMSPDEAAYRARIQQEDVRAAIEEAKKAKNPENELPAELPPAPTDPNFPPKASVAPQKAPPLPALPPPATAPDAPAGRPIAPPKARPVR